MCCTRILPLCKLDLQPAFQEDHEQACETQDEVLHQWNNCRTSPFQALHSECKADSRATISAIQASLHDLKAYFKRVKYNVPKLVEQTMELLNNSNCREQKPTTCWECSSAPSSTLETSKEGGKIDLGLEDLLHWIINLYVRDGKAKATALLIQVVWSTSL